MPLAIRERTVDGVTIVDLHGQLTLGDEASEARDRLTKAASSGEKKLLLNLQQVGHIDSTGLGTLVLGHSLLKDAGGVMKLLHLSKRHLELMVLTKLSSVFEIFDDEQMAINSFYSDREVRHFDILEFVKSQEDEESTFGAGSSAGAHDDKE